MARLNDTDGFKLHGWMVNGLGLKGGELFAFALVFRFSTAKAEQYKGGVPYLCAWIGCSENTARKYLHDLESKRLIKSKRGSVNGVPFCHYKVNFRTLQKLRVYPAEIEGSTPQNLEVDPSKTAVGTPQNLRVEQYSTGTIKGTVIDGNVSDIPERDAVKAYASSIGYQSFDVDRFFSWYDEHGWKSQKTGRTMDWKLAVRNWMKSDIARGIDVAREPKPKRGTNYETKITFDLR
jgi:hypothetical protein